MRKTKVKARFLVPLLAFVLAFALAPAAFADDLVAGGTAEGGSDTATETTVPDLNNAQITLAGTVFTYTGKPITPAITQVKAADGSILKYDQDYWFFYDDNVNVNSATSTPTVAVYNDMREDEEVTASFASFTIKPASIKSTKIKVTNEVYTGKKVKPDVLVTFNGATLKKGVDYTVKYDKRKKVGTGKVKITGKGNFTGSVKAKYKIRKASIKDVKFPNLKDKTYTGDSFRPTIKLKFKGKKLKKGKDYTVKYKSNKNVGVAKVKIKGKGNFKGSHTLEFAIHARSLSDCKVSLGYKQYWWTGNYLRPPVNVTYRGRTLSEGRDYTLSYANNRNLYSQARVYVRGIGNFTDTVQTTFDIVPFDLSYATTSPAKISDQKYTGYLIEPFKGKAFYVYQEGRPLVEGRDYIISYRNNLNPTTKNNQAEMIISGASRYFTGTKVIKFNIVDKK